MKTLEWLIDTPESMHKRETLCLLVVAICTGAISAIAFHQLFEANGFQFKHALIMSILVGSIICFAFFVIWCRVFSELTADDIDSAGRKGLYIALSVFLIAVVIASTTTNFHTFFVSRAYSLEYNSRLVEFERSTSSLRLVAQQRNAFFSKLTATAEKLEEQHDAELNSGLISSLNGSGTVTAVLRENIENLDNIRASERQRLKNISELVTVDAEQVIEQTRNQTGIYWKRQRDFLADQQNQYDNTFNDVIHHLSTVSLRESLDQMFLPPVFPRYSSDPDDRRKQIDAIERLLPLNKQVLIEPLIKELKIMERNLSEVHYKRLEHRFSTELVWKWKHRGIFFAILAFVIDMLPLVLLIQIIPGIDARRKSRFRKQTAPMTDFENVRSFDVRRKKSA